MLKHCYVKRQSESYFFDEILSKQYLFLFHNNMRIKENKINVFADEYKSIQTIIILNDYYIKLLNINNLYFSSQSIHIINFYSLTRIISTNLSRRRNSTLMLINSYFFINFILLSKTTRFFHSSYFDS